MVLTQLSGPCTSFALSFPHVGLLFFVAGSHSLLACCADVACIRLRFFPALVSNPITPPLVGTCTSQDGKAW